MTTLELLRKKAGSLPAAPGVYLMKNEDGVIIYVGKSKKLKNRVTSYFVGNSHTVKTEKMVGQVRDFDYIVCDTEMEALTLENVLIKKHTPKYNVKLKDAKSYPYIKITAGLYPKILVSRERKSDRAKYFGPYQGVAHAYGAKDTVERIFALPTCKREFPRDVGKERPCIYRDMGRCIAPCTGNVTPEEYGERMRRAESVLSGNIRDTVEVLRAEMTAAALDERFEAAAGYRDAISALEALGEKQKAVADESVNRDVFAHDTTPTEGVLSLLSVRGGKLVKKNQFILSPGTPSSEEYVSLIANYYDGADDRPREILLDFKLDEEDERLLAEYLTVLAGRKVTVRTPERGDGRALCDLALENAKEAARQERLTAERENKDLSRLAVLLNLDGIPKRIESYDISNYGDECAKASMVVAENGKFKKSNYRTFSVKTVPGSDDYGAMKEILTRRLLHVGDGTPSLGERPDLILLDGGDAHVATGRAAMEAAGCDVPLFGMVKDDFHKTRAITDGEREISIANEMNVYAFIYKLQEEVHRFAVSATRAAKSKTLTKSSLENIPGIGPAKAKLLLAALSLSEIRAADKQTLLQIKGIGEKDADAVLSYYREKRKRK